MISQRHNGALRSPSKRINPHNCSKGLATLRAFYCFSLSLTNLSSNVFPFGYSKGYINARCFWFSIRNTLEDRFVRGKKKQWGFLCGWVQWLRKTCIRGERAERAKRKTMHACAVFALQYIAQQLQYSALLGRNSC